MSRPPSQPLHLHLLLLLLPLLVAGELIPMSHETHYTRHRVNSSGWSPVQHVAVTRPLPTDKFEPVAKVREFTHGFYQTVGHPPATSAYYPPTCPWTRVVLEINGYCNGTQLDNVMAVWISGVELIRSSTPQAGSTGMSWTVQKDVTRYNFLLRQSNITLAVMLENAIDEIHVGGHWIDVFFLYYNIDIGGVGNLPRPVNPIVPGLNLGSSKALPKSLELDENPADLIIPISGAGELGFWFKIKSASDAVFQGIKIPSNTYRVVLEVFASPHGDDETWFGNPPDAYIELNRLPTRRGHGAFREILVRLDNNIVGSTIPFPVIYGGGINPLFWDPLAAIRSFDFPSYEVELTPFLGLLLDGRVHYYGLAVADAISYWLVNANLHLWLDPAAASGEQVLAGLIKFNNPTTSVERESEFRQLDGRFQIEASHECEWSGWVSYSAGNFTTQVTRKLDFENSIIFENNGAEKVVKQEVEVESRVRVTTDSGESVSRLALKSIYPMNLRITDLDGAGEGSLLTTRLKHSLEVQKQDQDSQSKLTDSQECKGWILVQDRDVLSGTATTVQSYKLDDRFGCFNRRVTAEGGVIKANDTTHICGHAASG